MSEAVAIRPLVGGDGEAAAAIHRESMPDPWDARTWAQFIGEPLVVALGAVGPARGGKGAGDRLVGAVLLRTVADEAEVLTIAVAPADRRRGIGRRLIEAALERARERGASRTHLEVAADNRAAIGLYRACGFRQCGQRAGYYRREAGRIDALLMTLPPGAGPDTA